MKNNTLDLWLKRFQLAKDWRSPYDDKWDTFYKLYRFYLEEDEQNWKSQLFIPYIFTIIENIVPRMVMNKPTIVLEGREEKDKDAARLHQALIDYQLDQNDIRIKLIQLIKSALIYGTGIAKVDWAFNTKNILSKEPILTVGGVKTGEKTVKKPSVLYDGPNVEILDIKDFFIEPGATNIELANWCIQRSVTTLKKLKESKIYDQKAVKKVKKSDNLNLNEFISGRDVVTDKDSTKEYQSDDEFVKVELLECWTDEYVTTIANRQIIIRQEENPYPHQQKPFVRIVDTLVPNEFYGIGEAERLEVLQRELNSVRNARMDNTKFRLNKVLLVARSAGVNYKNLFFKPGAIIPANDINQIRPLEMSDISGSSFNEETIIKGDIQRVSGISEYTMGRGNEEQTLANNTATGIRLLQEAGNQIIKMKTLLFEEMGLREIGKMIVALNNFFINQTRIIRIIGEEGKQWIKIKPEDIRGNFDVRVEAGSTEPVDQDLKRQQLIQLFQLTLTNPYTSQWINTPNFLDKLYEIFKVGDIERLLYTPEQLAKAKAEIQRSKAQDILEAQPPQVEVMPEGGETQPSQAGVSATPAIKTK